MILGVTGVKWQLCPSRGAPWEGSDKYIPGVGSQKCQPVLGEVTDCLTCGWVIKAQDVVATMVLPL